VSLDNRRLYCLKQFQMERSEDVMVSINVVELNHFLETFVCHMDEGNKRHDSHTIRVRPPRSADMPLAKRARLTDP
jgi:hypothetical protein